MKTVVKKSVVKKAVAPKSAPKGAPKKVPVAPKAVPSKSIAPKKAPVAPKAVAKKTPVEESPFLVFVKFNLGDGYPCMSLFNIIAETLEKTCIKFDKGGIYIRDSDKGETLLIDAFVDRASCTRYDFEMDEPRWCYVNFKDIKDEVKIRKKDGLEMCIRRDTPNILEFKTIPKKEGAVSHVEHIPISNLEESDLFQHRDIQLPDAYDYPFVVPSSSFQQLKKKTVSSNVINIKLDGSKYLEFHGNKNGMETNKWSIPIGTPPHKDKRIYDSPFNSSTINSLNRLHSLSPILSFYSPQDLENIGYPLKISAKLGQGIGLVNIFIKDSNTIALEKQDNGIQDPPPKRRGRKKHSEL